MRIGCDDGKTFFDCLGNEYAVERVAVMHRETFEREQMVQIEGQSSDLILSQSADHVGTSGLRKIQLSQLHLNQNFPNTGDTQKQVTRADE